VGQDEVRDLPGTAGSMIKEEDAFIAPSVAADLVKKRRQTIFKKMENT